LFYVDALKFAYTDMSRFHKTNGLTENAGRENDGPSKLQGMKLTDQFAGHENAEHEHDGPKMTAWHRRD